MEGLQMKEVLVCGAGGFIGNHLVERLKREGCFVRGLDLKAPSFSDSAADEFLFADLRDFGMCRTVMYQRYDEIYQLAADMGGAGYLFSGENNANVLRNSALINLNVLEAARLSRSRRVFFSSSACMYPETIQDNPQSSALKESDAYPAQPDSEYGWEKLFSERLYLAYARNYNMEPRIARFHNIFGPKGTWGGGKEKASAAMCRKVAETADGGEIEVWGDGEQSRTFLYIDECIEGVLRLMRSNVSNPLNIGSDERVTINQLAEMAIEISGKKLSIRHVPGPQGVRGRCSDNTLLHASLGWKPSQPLRVGMEKTYAWVVEKVKERVYA